MYSDANITTAQKESKGLGAELSAPCGAEADNPRKILVDAWKSLAVTMASWKSMITLTIANEHMCFEEGMDKRWRSLVQRLNVDLYGNNYVRRVGHSYFSYLEGVEYQTRLAVHLHVLVDQPVNFSLIHRLWNHMSGFAYIEPVVDVAGAVDYVCKYVVKGEDLKFFIQPLKVLPCPAFLPDWYRGHLEDGHPHRKALNKYVKRLF